MPMAHALRTDGPPARPEPDPDCIAVGIEAAGWLPAFSAGSQIMTGDGPVAAGWLRPGDLALTRDSGLQPVVWVGRCHVPAAAAAARPDLWPVRLAPGAMGRASPAAPLTVAPSHRVLVRGWALDLHLGLREALAVARDLVGRPGIARVAPEGPLDLYLVLLERHEAILADGLWVESLHPGDIPADVLSAPGAGRLRTLSHEVAASCGHAVRPVLTASETVFVPDGAPEEAPMDEPARLTA
jgi:hypothetical protein